MISLFRQEHTSNSDIRTVGQSQESNFLELHQIETHQMYSRLFDPSILYCRVPDSF